MPLHGLILSGRMPSPIAKLIIFDSVRMALLASAGTWARRAYIAATIGVVMSEIRLPLNAGVRILPITPL